MKRTCPHCGAAIAPENNSQPWTTCVACQAVFNPTVVAPPADLTQIGAALPKGTELHLLPHGFQMTYNWYNPIYFGLAFVAVMWNSFLFWMLTDIGWWLLLVPPVWIGLGLAAYALINLINRTTLTVKPNELKIVHFPIPYPGNHHFDPIILKQLYVKEVKHQSKSSVSYTYDLYVSTWAGRQYKVASRIKEAGIALALEKEIERFLQIKDRAMPGEFRWLSDRERKQLCQTWQALAAELSLTFEPDVATEKAGVSGVYRGYHLYTDVFYSNTHRRTCTRLLLTPVTPPVYSYPLLSEEIELGQPLSLEQLLALLAPGGLPKNEGEQVDVNAEAKKFYYENDRSISDVQQLRRVINWMVKLADGYAKVRAIGAETLPALEALAVKFDHVLSSVARQLIRDIAAETTARLGDQPANFYCQRCLTRCAAHSTQLNLIQTITYYGCRTCHQSRALLEWAGPVIAVLDSRMTEKWVEQDGTLWVNWLNQRTPFDFEAVEIVQAGDEEVERFAVQIGNDTDSQRKVNYELIPCRIGLTCHLSENSLRVLRSIFGPVERLPLLADVVDTMVNDQRREFEDQDQSVGGSASTA